VNQKHRFGYRLRFTAKKEDTTIQKLLKLLANYCILKASRAIILLQYCAGRINSATTSKRISSCIRNIKTLSLDEYGDRLTDYNCAGLFDADGCFEK
jgi:hypothetical protein